MTTYLLRFPLILVLTGFTALSMFIPALHAMFLDDHSVARAFGYSGVLGLALVMTVGLEINSHTRRS